MLETAAKTKQEERRFKVQGMDCGSCVERIETAVARIDGVTGIALNMTTETLTAAVRDEAASNAVVQTVKSLGYQIVVLSPSSDISKSAGQKHERHDGDGQEHPGDASPDDHAAVQDRGTSEDGWWKTNRGRLVIATGCLLVVAFLASKAFPAEAQWIFVGACLIGVVPIARRAFSAARYGSMFTIEMLMTIATIGALAIGAAEEAAVVVFLFAVGELLETVAAGRARAGIKALAAIAPKTALVETPAGLQELGIEAVAIGDIVVVRAGDRVPADGTVDSGTSSVDESALTGESVPRLKSPGDAVFAGSINTESTLRCRVEKPATETLIARVVHLVEQAAQSKAPTQRFIDRFARLYMPAICLIALAVAVVPPLLMGEPWATWIYRGLTLLLIGCPCALVISTPAAIASALAAGARRGLLVKGGAVLEAIGKVKTIAFDKTGTLTAGKPTVTDVVPLAGADPAEVLRLAASVDATSSHPLAVSIVNRANADGISFDLATDTKAMPGKGVEGLVGARKIFVGAPGRLNVADPTVIASAIALQQQGKTVSVVVADGTAIGLIALRDEPREDAATALRSIADLGIRTLMLTGDNAATARAIGQVLGIEVRADLLPEDKLSAIKQLSAEGGVAAVGDGINDAPALAAATVGIAMGSGTDVALETADAAILHNRVADVAALVILSRRTLSVIRENVTISLALKAVFLVTTVLGITGLWIAVLADTGATVLVTANALRLLHTQGS